ARRRPRDAGFWAGNARRAGLRYGRGGADAFGRHRMAAQPSWSLPRPTPPRRPNDGRPPAGSFLLAKKLPPVVGADRAAAAISGSLRISNLRFTRSGPR